jgi:hypothetical protein
VHGISSSIIAVVGEAAGRLAMLPTNQFAELAATIWPSPLRLARLLLLPTAFDVAGNPTRDGTDRSASPSTATGDRGNASAGRSTDGRTAHCPLLLGRHRGATDHARCGEDCGKQ